MSFIYSTLQLGQAIRATRKQLRLTLSQLAYAIGVGTRFIVDVEARNPTLRLEKVLRVVQALGVDLALMESQTRVEEGRPYKRRCNGFRVQVQLLSPMPERKFKFTRINCNQSLEETDKPSPCWCRLSNNHVAN